MGIIGRVPRRRITESVLRDIERAICWGWSMLNACNYAGIPERTYYDYVKRHPEFRSKIEMLRSRPELVAKRNISMRIEAGDIETSKWYLERRSLEFHPKGSLRVEAEFEVDDAAVMAALHRLMQLQGRLSDPPLE